MDSAALNYIPHDAHVDCLKKRDQNSKKSEGWEYLINGKDKKLVPNVDHVWYDHRYKTEPKRCSCHCLNYEGHTCEEINKDLYKTNLNDSAGSICTCDCADKT